MNNNINIAEILKDYPKGTKLYSPLFGNIILEEINYTGATVIRIRYSPKNCTTFYSTGLYYNYEDAECLLFPSSEMRDWSKFFKRGDIITNGNVIAVFKEWTDSTYTYFKTSLYIWSSEEGRVYTTESTYNVTYFQLASKTQQEHFIKRIEAFYNGKFNPITLRVEPVKPEVTFNLKPFDKVLVRDYLNQKWTINMFSYYDSEEDSYHYVCVNSQYRYCLPYNEQTAHLVGTTNNK